MGYDVHVLRDNTGEPVLTIVDGGRVMSVPLRIVFDTVTEFIAVDARSSLSREAYRKRTQKAKASLTKREVLDSPSKADAEEDQYALPALSLEEG